MPTIGHDERTVAYCTQWMKGISIVIQVTEDRDIEIEWKELIIIVVMV
jgi:hypothetical protein